MLYVFYIFSQSPQSIELISTMKADKKLPVLDADWASAEHSVIMFSDYSIRVFDLKLIKSYSSIYTYEFDGQNITAYNVIKYFNLLNIIFIFFLIRFTRTSCNFRS